MAGRWGLWVGLIGFAAMLAVPAPAGMPPAAWHTAAVLALMATWWITQALPLSVTALTPFIAFPFLGVMTASDTASSYWSPIIFLVLGGSILALAIERTGLHRRLALAIVSRGGRGPGTMLFAFMAATALISAFVSNTATALIMIPLALAVIRAAGAKEGETGGFAGAVILGVAFAASIGGLATIVGSPTNAISVGIIDEITGVRINFLTWAAYGVPLVAVTVPVTWAILMRVLRVKSEDFDSEATLAAIGQPGPWSVAERRLVPVLLVVIGLWVTAPVLAPFFPRDSLTDGTIAVLGAALLFLIPAGEGRTILTWEEAMRAPWGVMLLYGGGLALAAAIGESGLAMWLGEALRPLAGVPTILIVAVIVGIVILVTEFASNVAAASGIMPVIGGLIIATGADPMLLAIPAAFAASWGFMLPSGSAPNAIAWATGHVALSRMLLSGLLLDLAGIPIMVGIVWIVSQLLG